MFLVSIFTLLQRTKAVEPQNSMFGLDTSSTKAFLDPPNEVKHLLKIGLGLEFGIAPISTFFETFNNPDHGEDDGHDVCGDLATIMNSEMNFVVVSASDPINGAAKVVLDDAAANASCDRKKEKRRQERKSNSCPDAQSALAEEGIKNPVSRALGLVLPICMG